MPHDTIPRIFTLLLVAGFAVSQNPADSEALLRRAKELNAKGELELASVALYRAEAAHRGKPTKTSRAVLRLLPKVDPQLTIRRKTMTSAAKTLNTLSSFYKRKKWYGLASKLALEAEQLDAKVPKSTLRALERAAPNVFAGTARSKKTMRNSKWKVSYKNAHFAGDDGFWTGKALRTGKAAKSNDSPLVTFEPAIQGVCELTVDVKQPNGFGQAAVVFGVDGSDYYILELAILTASCSVNVKRMTPTSVKSIEEQWTSIPEADRKKWVRYTIQFREKELIAFFNGKAGIRMPRPPKSEGEIGFYVSAASPPQAVQFRNLRVGPLTLDPPLDRPNESMKRLKKEISSGSKEAATLMLFDWQARCRREPDPALAKRVEALLSEACLEHKKLAAERGKVGAMLMDLAEQYSKAGWARIEVDVLEQAALFSAVAAESWRAKLPKSK